MLSRPANISPRAITGLLVFLVLIVVSYERFPLLPTAPPTDLQEQSTTEPHKEGATHTPSGVDTPPPVQKEPEKVSSDESYPRPEDVEAVLSDPGQFPLALPEDYNEPPTPVEWCAKAFGHEYLHDFRDHHHSYCQKSASLSEVECFTNKWDQGLFRTFCTVENVVLRPSKERVKERAFGFQCQSRDWFEEGKAKELGEGPEGPRTDLFDLPIEMFDTGPGQMMKDHLEVWNSSNIISPVDEEVLKACSKRTTAEKEATGYKILIKRDPSHGAHHWHSMMEIISLHWQIDALRITRNADNRNQPYYTLTDLANSQLIIMDDQEDGPFFDLWKLVANQAPVRLFEIDQNPETNKEPLCIDKMLIPLAGGSNPLWAGDWEPRHCDHAPNLDAFIQRALKFYDIRDRRPLDAPITVTAIERVRDRKLKNSIALYEAVGKVFPDEKKVKINFVDFGSKPWREQLQIAQETDVLIGVHGAALAMGMWMPRGGAMAEVIPHDFWHKGFRNLARMRGHRYFSAHSLPIEDERGWQRTDFLEIEPDRFVELVKTAIYSTLQSRLVNEDMV